MGSKREHFPGSCFAGAPRDNPVGYTKFFQLLAAISQKWGIRRVPIYFVPPAFLTLRTSAVPATLFSSNYSYDRGAGESYKFRSPFSTLKTSN